MLRSRIIIIIGTLVILFFSFQTRAAKRKSLPRQIDVYFLGQKAFLADLRGFNAHNLAGQVEDGFYSRQNNDDSVVNLLISEGRITLVSLSLPSEKEEALEFIEQEKERYKQYIKENIVYGLGVFMEDRKTTYALTYANGKLKITITDKLKYSPIFLLHTPENND